MYMKKVMCKEIGDPNEPQSECEHEFHVNNLDELAQQAAEHVMTEPSHIKDKEKMMNATKEKKQNWMTYAQKVLDSKKEE